MDEIIWNSNYSFFRKWKTLQFVDVILNYAMSLKDFTQLFIWYGYFWDQYHCSFEDLWNSHQLVAAFLYIMYLHCTIMLISEILSQTKRIFQSRKLFVYEINILRAIFLWYTKLLLHWTFYVHDINYWTICWPSIQPKIDQGFKCSEWKWKPIN